MLDNPENNAKDNPMKLVELGLNSKLKKFINENKLNDFEIGRVIAEHKELYIVQTNQGELEAEITGNLRFSANKREDFPAVGDWVALTIYDELAIIHRILPRYSIIKRQAIAEFGEVQILASNVDYALILQAVDRDFNINRLERYLSICDSSKIIPIIIITKIDLITEEEISEIKEKIQVRINNATVIPISNKTQKGYQVLNKVIEKGKTYCLLGSSGVGKSSLVNNLSAKDLMRTDSISESTNRGKHVTTHRELILLKNGAILIDNPGIKEVGITDKTAGFENTFNEIYSLAKDCKFKNCTHTTELGCSVLLAIKNGELDKTHYNNYLKIQKEKDYFESTVTEKRQQEKSFAKMQKDYKKKNIKRG